MRKNARREAKNGGKLDLSKLRRNVAEVKPMSRFSRFKLQFAKEKSQSKQVYIPPKEQRTSLLGFIWQILKDPFHYGFRDLVLWRISTSYMNFFVQSLVFFLIYIHIFAVFIYLAISASYRNNGVQCANSWFYDGENTARHNLEIAFELSWITFTTVGYGNVSPSGSIAGCYGLRYLCAFEAFIGLVYFSLLGAIFFSKIGLTFGEAPITFSSALCLKYDTNSTHFPVLEMQIVHNKANQVGHEILGASLLCMVAIDVPVNHDHSAVTAAATGEGCGGEDQNSKIFTLDFMKGGHGMSSSRVAKQTYHSIKLVGGTHPYFNRVWHCRHILDEHSPLLRNSVKEEIKELGGWPISKRSNIGIRLALVPFNTMIVTMKGMSSLHSRSVFAEKRYYFDDIFIGWDFAGLMYLKEDSRTEEQQVRVDMNLIHDILPQGANGADSIGSNLSFRSHRSGSIKV